MSGRNAFGIPISDSLCPDCDASMRIVEVRPGVSVVQIYHDDTCPALRIIEGASNEPPA